MTTILDLLRQQRQAMTRLHPFPKGMKVKKLSPAEQHDLAEQMAAVKAEERSREIAEDLETAKRKSELAETRELDRLERNKK